MYYTPLVHYVHTKFYLFTNPAFLVLYFTVINNKMAFNVTFKQHIRQSELNRWSLM